MRALVHFLERLDSRLVSRNRMMKKKSAKPKSLRQILCSHVASICAYKDKNMLPDARKFTQALVTTLISEGLYELPNAAASKASR